MDHQRGLLLFIHLLINILDFIYPTRRQQQHPRRPMASQLSIPHTTLYWSNNTTVRKDYLPSTINNNNSRRDCCKNMRTCQVRPAVQLSLENRNQWRIYSITPLLIWNHRIESMNISNRWCSRISISIRSLHFPTWRYTIIPTRHVSSDRTERWVRRRISSWSMLSTRPFTRTKQSLFFSHRLVEIVVLTLFFFFFV